ncbi:hypothetical protein DY245_25445 [Streptomyces inhibens]|uniref:Transposase IS4-like domain-containing protein n=1 Tax=Streptomyces inhibens TaxID=2293571 RepID=A0A371PYZ1_STRIH|nr:hypothetical protein DY245_25445 [Streptomyces inhibens]
MPGAYDQMVGLELEEPSADGCITKAPSGGECAGKSPVDHAEQGVKGSQLTDGYGIPVVTVPAGANLRDHTLLPEPLDEFTTIVRELRCFPQYPALSLDAGYDYQPVYADLARRDITPRITSARHEDTHPDRREVVGRAHERVDEQLRQTPPLHRTTVHLHGVLPRARHHDLHRA